MNNRKKLLSIVFPVYQNAKNLPHLLIEINDFIDSLIDYDLELTEKEKRLIKELNNG